MKRATSGLGMLVIMVLVLLPLECGLTVVHSPGDCHQHE
jgi:hypothetical protein